MRTALVWRENAKQRKRISAKPERRPCCLTSCLIFEKNALSVSSSYYRHQFRDLAALVGLVAAADRVFHAVSHVIPKDFFFNPAERGPHRRDLGNDVDAVPVLVDHFREPANLAFDAVQAFLARSLDLVSHGPYIPP